MFVLVLIYRQECISDVPVSLKQYHSLDLIPKQKSLFKLVVKHFIYGTINYFDIARFTASCDKTDTENILLLLRFKLL
jgi:hypothetical protein